MLAKLLIANRGEIAVRVARTARRLGVRTVVVYSDADRRALHVEACDEARRLGPAEAARSYLDGKAVVEAALCAGADAIHPGYGFLSENAELAESCARAGLVFVGPRAETIREMGSKQRARALAERIGVPIVPGWHGAASDDDAALAREAARIGFPLLVKASAGGGGRGIRRADDAAALGEALALARREALSAFGDGALVLERYVAEARHVEVQVLGDRHGRRVALFDRDCSVQRRHQKLVEEAPAPGLPAAVRAGLREAALRLADAIGYENAGTVEFLYDAASEAFYFLEMNTRLQVEHPVTEGVTGLDLVEWQLRVASGEAIPADLGGASPQGVAIEARLCAERTGPGLPPTFTPATGTIRRFELPAHEGVRVDAGFGAGSEVGAHYDSLLAKVVAHGRDRAEACRRLEAALDALVVTGVETNADLLRDVVASDAFRSGPLSTRFLERPFAAPGDAAAEALDRLAAAIAWIRALDAAGEGPGAPPLAPWTRLGPWRTATRAGRGAATPVELRAADGAGETLRVEGHGGAYRVHGDDGPRDVAAWEPAPGLLRLERGGAQHRRAVDADLAGGVVWVSGGGRHRRFAVVSREQRAERSAAAAAGDARSLEAPFPGLVTLVSVAPGARVEAGDALVTMEAMKMVHRLAADGAGVVRAVHCRAGQSVAAGALLVEIEPCPDGGRDHEVDLLR